MTALKLTLALFFGLGVAGSAPVAMAQAAATAAHEAHEVHASKPPAPTQRFATDAPLRDGMSRIQRALDELPQNTSEPLSARQVLASVATIEAAGASIFANCTLPEDADNALHSILVPLLGAAQALKKNPQDRSAVATMHEAVSHYPHYFDVESPHEGH